MPAHRNADTAIVVPAYREATVVGGVVSTVHVYEAGVASTLPAASTARTSIVCEPSARDGVV